MQINTQLLPPVQRLLHLLQHIAQLRVRPKLQAVLQPVPRLLQPAHLLQTLALSPVRLLVPGLLELDAAVRVREALGPVVDPDVRLGPVAVELLQLVPEDGRGLPAGPGQGHLDRVGVEVDGLAVVLLAEGGVAGVAHLLDHGGAVRVDGDGGGRDAVGDGGLLEAAVEGVEGLELAREEGVGGGGGDVFGGGVEGDGEEEEGVAGEGSHGG